jgi:signal transduction histidine kinase
MRIRTWLSVAISFLVLLTLVPLFAWLVSRKAALIDARARDAHSTYRAADDAITEIRADIYKAVLVFREASRTGDTAAAERQLGAIREQAAHHFSTLALCLDATQHPQIVALRRGLAEYWRSASDGGGQPEDVLRLAERIDSLNEANLSLEEQQIQIQQRTLRRFATAATGLLLLLGIGIAIASTAHLAKLERASENERIRAENAESELRRLSNQLVRVQEDERRNISRELHDEIGQILTGLRMELGSLSRGEGDGAFRQRLDSVKHLAEEALRSVRNLALLLRPSMLDDLGLEPALRWQAKEVSQRSGIPVSLDIQGELHRLPEPVRICLYRAIQEALTNCIKHADATRVTVTVKQERDVLTASVQDNGKGFDVHHMRTQGLGLVGMEERVRALAGRLTISSQPGKGTLVTLSLPLAAEFSASA